MHKSIRRLSIGAAVPSRDPTAVKCNDVQELAVEILPCTEGNFAEPHPEGEKKPHHEWVSYNASFLVHFCANRIRGPFSAMVSLCPTNENVFLVGSLASPHPTKDRKH